MQAHHAAHRGGQGRRRLVDADGQRIAFPGQRARPDSEVGRAPLDRRAPPLGQRPAVLILTVQDDVERTVVHRVGRPEPARPGIVRRKHGADEGDQRQPMAAVFAQRIDIPPGVAVGRYRLVEARSASSARRRDPARQRRHRHPGSRMRAPPGQIQTRYLRLRPRPAERRLPPVLGQAVQRSACRREHLVELRRRRHHRRFRAAVHGQATAGQKGECPSLALLDLRCVEKPGVTLGRRVDQAEQALGTARESAGVVAVLRADVDGWLGGKPADGGRCR